MRRVRRGKLVPPKKRKRPPKAPPPAQVANVLDVIQKPKTPLLKPGDVIRVDLQTSGSVSVEVEYPGTDDGEGEHSYGYLRFAAGIAFTTDVSGVTVAELAKRAPFVGVVPPTTMAYWATADHWAARREAMIVDWRRQIEAKIGQKQVAQALVDLDHADRMLAQSLDKIQNGMVAVNSYEGLINSTVRLMEFRAGLRAQVLSTVAPTMGGVPGNASPGSQLQKPQLSVEDARAAAAAVIKRRRDEIRAEQAKRDAEKSGQPLEGKPDLKLLPGAGG